MQPVKIIMGLHPNAGWRSFKTDEKISHYIGSRAIFAAAPGLWPPEETTTWWQLTAFGRRLLAALTAINSAVAFVRLRDYQFEVFLTEESGGWEAYELVILRDIALAHSGQSLYELEVRDMSGGATSWDSYFLEELEEIEEYENSFAR